MHPHTALALLALLCATAATAMSTLQPPRTMSKGKATLDPENNPIYIPGYLSSRFLQAQNITIKGKGFVRVLNTANLHNTLNCKTLEADELSAKILQLNTLRSPPDAPISLFGGIQVNGNVLYAVRDPAQARLDQLTKDKKKAQPQARSQSASVANGTSSKPRFAETATQRRIARLEERQRQRRRAWREDREHRQRSGQDDSDFEESAAFVELLSVVSHAQHPDDATALPANAGEVAVQRAHHRQWRMVERDDFHVSAAGWQFSDGTSAEANRTHCAALGLAASADADSDHADRFLHAAVAQASAPSTPTLSVSKEFSALPVHRLLQLEARVHFADAGSGGVVFAQVDGEYVWLDTHHVPVDAPLPAAGITLCGGAEAPSPFSRHSLPVKVIVPHNSDTVTVSFGTSSASSYAVFGIDDVSLSVM